MKRFLCLAVIVTLCACTLKPAPITSMDVKSELLKVPQESRTLKAAELQAMVSERRAELEAKRKSLNKTLTVIAIATLSPVAVGGPTYLIQLPARKAIKKERRSMAEKETEIKVFMGDIPNEPRNN